MMDRSLIRCKSPPVAPDMVARNANDSKWVGTLLHRSPMKLAAEMMRWATQHRAGRAEPLGASAEFLTQTASNVTIGGNMRNMRYRLATMTLFIAVTFLLTTAHARPTSQVELDLLDMCLPPYTSVQSLTASPQTIKPFMTTTLNWQADKPKACYVLGLYLNHQDNCQLVSQSISATGTRTEQPTQPATTYSIIAKMFGYTTGPLKSTTVTVDTSQCLVQSISEADILTEVQKAVDAVDAASNRIYQTKPATAQVDANGITIAAFFKIAVPVFADPDLTINATINLCVVDGVVEPSYRSFNINVKWPAAVKIVTLWATEFVASVLEQEIKTGLKLILLQALKDIIDDYLALPQQQGQGLFMLEMVPHAIDATICPIP